MTYHNTYKDGEIKGHISLIDSWGHGKGPRHDWSRAVSVIVTDDGDGHYDAWRFSGKRALAMEKLSEFWVDKDGVSVAEGNTLTLIEPPDDFWVEDSAGDFHPDFKKYPNIMT